MRKLLIIALLMTASACSKDELTLRPENIYNLSFDLGLPSLTSKVPTCKLGEPTRIAYSVTNDRNEEFTYFGDVQEINGRYVNANEIELVAGNYTINSIELINGNDVLYSVPDVTDGTILHYANLILPLEITMNENVNVSGTAFCYDQLEPDFSGVVGGDYDTLRLESLFFQVVDRGCTNLVTVTIDGYRIPEITIFESGVYEVAVPQEYRNLSIYTYDADGTQLLVNYTFDETAPYDNETLLIIDNTCE